MTTVTFRSVQIVDRNLDRIWQLTKVLLKRMPGILQRRIDEAQLQAWFLRFRRAAETFVVDANARKHLLLVGGRRLATRFFVAGLLWGRTDEYVQFTGKHRNS